MTLSGKSSYEAAGLSVPHREEIYRRITALGEGAIFTATDLLGDDVHLADDLQKLRGFDYVHLYDGHNTGIVETPSIRKLPKLQLFLEAYELREGCMLHSSGDRIAYLMRIKEWEPILGHRFYTDGISRVVSFGQMRIRMINAPAWLMNDDDQYLLLRAFFDTPAREMDDAIVRARQMARVSEAQILEAAELARTLSTADVVIPPEAELHASLGHLADAIEGSLAKYNARSTTVMHVARKRP